MTSLEKARLANSDPPSARISRVSVRQVTAPKTRYGVGRLTQCGSPYSREGRSIFRQDSVAANPRYLLDSPGLHANGMATREPPPQRR